MNKAKELWNEWSDAVIKIAMIALAAVTTTFVYLFQRNVMPDGWLGEVTTIASAVSLVLVYVGLAVAKIDQGQRRKVFWVTVAAMVIEVVYGTVHVAEQLYNEAHLGEPGLLDNLPDWAAWVLGGLHAAPFSVLLFLVALLVFHDPTRDADILKRLQEALARVTGLETQLSTTEATLRAEFAVERDVLQQNAAVVQRQVKHLEAENESIMQLRSLAEGQWAEREAMLLVQLDEAQNALESALSVASNTVPVTLHMNGRGKLTDQIRALLEENFEYTNAELVERTGGEEGSVKVIASRVRKQMKESVSVLN